MHWDVLELVDLELIVSQDYSVPVLMRATIDQVMRKQFNNVQADEELRAVVEKFVPGEFTCIPVVNASGGLVGIVEAHDLLRAEPADHHFTMRELARQDYVVAYPGEAVDRVQRDMMLKNVEDVIVVESPRNRKPIGIARANDILELRRWLLEEETGELRRVTLDEPAESLGVKLDQNADGKPKPSGSSIQNK